MARFLSRPFLKLWNCFLSPLLAREIFLLWPATLAGPVSRETRGEGDSGVSAEGAWSLEKALWSGTRTKTLGQVVPVSLLLLRWNRRFGPPGAVRERRQAHQNPVQRGTVLCVCGYIKTKHNDSRVVLGPTV